MSKSFSIEQARAINLLIERVEYKADDKCGLKDYYCALSVYPSSYNKLQFWIDSFDMHENICPSDPACIIENDCIEDACLSLFNRFYADDYYRNIKKDFANDIVESAKKYNIVLLEDPVNTVDTIVSFTKTIESGGEKISKNQIEAISKLVKKAEMFYFGPCIINRVNFCSLTILPCRTDRNYTYSFTVEINCENEGDIVAKTKELLYEGNSIEDACEWLSKGFVFDKERVAKDVEMILKNSKHLSDSDIKTDLLSYFTDIGVM